jgi:hypothetical protein
MNDKRNVVCLYNATLFSLNKKGNPASVTPWRDPYLHKVVKGGKIMQVRVRAGHMG